MTQNVFCLSQCSTELEVNVFSAAVGLSGL